MRRSEADRRGLKPLAIVAGHATYANTPALFPTAPIGAIRRLLELTGWSLAEIDLFEINEAFAVVAMAAMRDLGLPHEKVNVHGGACALGHPIGASGARISSRCLRRSRNANFAAESLRSASAAAKRRPLQSNLSKIERIVWGFEKRAAPAQRRRSARVTRRPKQLRQLRHGPDAEARQLREIQPAHGPAPRLSGP